MRMKGVPHSYHMGCNRDHLENQWVPHRALEYGASKGPRRDPLTSGPPVTLQRFSLRVAGGGS